MSHNRGCFGQNSLKKLVLAWVCCCEGPRVSRTVETPFERWPELCRGRQGCGRRAPASPWLPWILCPGLRGAKSGHGIRRELPQLSRLSARETWKVIRASGHKANSLCRAPEEGWAVLVFGEAKSPGLVLCTLIIV